MSARWLDHLPPWLSLMALAPSGLFGANELMIMSLPLILAAMVEWRGWNLKPWRRSLELMAVLVLLLMGAAHISLIQLLTNLVFLLCGIRLALPRTLAQRRQLLLMGFLLLLMAAMSLPSLDFALWAALWTVVTARSLAHQAWSMPGSGPPLRSLGAWTAVILLISALCFLALPRVGSASQLSGWGIRGFGSAVGLADALDLADRGPLRGQSGVVLRLVPQGALDPDLRAKLAERLALLKGLSLEALDGARWELGRDTPHRRSIRLSGQEDAEFPRGPGLELQLAPSGSGPIPLPYGKLTLKSPRPWLLGPQQGGAIGWNVPPRQMTPLEVSLQEEQPEKEALTLDRRVLLTLMGEGTEVAERWSRTIVPQDLSASVLAARLGSELRSYRYTLDNPSGRAANPLEDFLERTKSGHCEYFASALACALRSRHVPARVAVGYRLGAWNPQGGYWLVTQNEAHSWVEYYDADTSQWCVADPTPAAPAAASPFLSRLRNIQDALQYRWDRYVVRFSDQDQVTGMDWLQGKASHLAHWPFQRIGIGLAAALGLAGAAFWLWKWRWTGSSHPVGIRELAPLIRKARKVCPPAPGESARSWLKRLATLSPDQQAPLLQLADEVDAATYGSGNPQPLIRLAKEAARNFRPLQGKSMENRGTP